MTIQDLYALKGVVVKNFPKAVPLPCKDPALVYGVELEIENVPGANDMVVPGMEAKRDGSLRNNGMEFITKPMTYSNLAYCLNTFFTKNKLSDANYSERCSIHVHANVLDLEESQVQSIALLYQVVERVLFAWIGYEREENIFCVPWHQTNLTYRTLGGKAEKLRGWEKYTALNFLPMFTQGTLEFRHMHGHHDVARILKWCNIIGSLFAWARAYPLAYTKDLLLQLNTSSAYDLLMHQVFGDLVAEFNNVKNYSVLLEEGVLDIKYALITKEEKEPPKTIAPAPRRRNLLQAYADLIERDGAQAAEWRINVGAGVPVAQQEMIVFDEVVAADPEVRFVIQGGQR